MAERVAAVPAHKDPNKDPADFGALNKVLRACHLCRLVKSEKQFEELGCDNCPDLQMEGDRYRVQHCTTTNFSGMITVMDPDRSWAAKWLHLQERNGERLVPGAYALVVNDELPEELRGQ